MRVRVYDEPSRTYFHSELYAALYSGIFERDLILREGRLLLSDKWRREGNTYSSQIRPIDPAFPEDWITLTNGKISDFPDFPKHLPEDKWTAFRGFPWVWEDKKTLRRLLCGEAVPLSETVFPPVSSRLPGWNYVTTKEETGALMEQYRDFHDAVLVDLHYVSGSKQLPDGSMLVSDVVRQVSMRFHSDWAPPLEMVFEGVEGLDLRPADEDRFSCLEEATLRFRDGAVFFCDGFCEDEALYSGTKLSAYSLRWRFMPPVKHQSTSK